MIVLDRGVVTLSTYNGKCEACSKIGLGVMITGAADCGCLICAHCLGDAFVLAMPELSREFVRRNRVVDRATRRPVMETA